MKRIGIFAAAFCIAVVGQAALLDDFEGYAIDNASNASPKWVTTEASYFADIDVFDGSQMLAPYGSADYRDISTSLGGTFAGLMTNEFDVYVTSEADLDLAFGLSDNAAGNWYDQYGPYVRVTTDTGDTNGNNMVSLDVRDGTGFVDDIAPLNIGQTYTIKLVADTSTKTFDVYVDGSLVYGPAGFRKQITEANTFLVMAGGGQSQYNVAIDNVSFSGSGVPFTIDSWSPTGTGITNQPTLEVVLIDGTDTVNTNSIVLTLNGSNVTHSIVQSGPTTTVSYAVSPALEEVTTYTGRVVVAGNSSGTSLTQQWEFVTAAVGEYIPVGYTLYEDFESYPDSGNRFTNGVTTAGKWLYIDNTTIAPNGNNTGLCDIEDDGSETFARFGWSNPARGFVSDIPNIAEGSSGSYFFRIKTQDSTPDCSFGISDQPITTTTNWTWSAFEIQIALTGSINLGARTGTVVSNLVSGVPVDTWVNIQVDIQNNIGTNDTYDIYASYGGDTPALMASGLKFRNGTTNSLTTFFTYHNTAQGDRTACFDDVYYNIGGGPVLDPYDITSIVVAGGNATITWQSQAGASYNILSKSALTDATWTTNATKASDGDGTTSETVGAGVGELFFRVEGQ